MQLSPVSCWQNLYEFVFSTGGIDDAFQLFKPANREEIPCCTTIALSDYCADACTLVVELKDEEDILEQLEANQVCVWCHTTWQWAMGTNEHDLGPVNLLYTGTARRDYW